MADSADAAPNPDILTEFKPFQESLEGKIVKEDGTHLEALARIILHVMTHDGERGKSSSPSSTLWRSTALC